MVLENTSLQNCGAVQCRPPNFWINSIFLNIFGNRLWENGATDFHEIFRVCSSRHGLLPCKFSWPTELIFLVKSATENRHFHDLLYFYIVGAGKNFFETSKITSLSLLALCTDTGQQSRAGAAGQFGCRRA